VYPLILTSTVPKGFKKAERSAKKKKYKRPEQS